MKLTRAGLARAAEMLRAGSDGVALLRTVMAVECRGSGFDRQGRALILYEPHVAYRCSSGVTRARLVAAGLAYPKWGEKPYPKDSYPSYQAAATVNPEIAAKACSWGLGQILGENFRAAGYTSAVQMAFAMQGGEDEQAAAMVRFIIANPKMHAALLAHDWGGFASRYNGPGYAKNGYDRKLAASYAKYAKMPWDGFGGAQNSIKPGATQAQQIQQAKTQAAQGAVIAATGGATATVATAPMVEAPSPTPPKAEHSIWPAAILGVGTILIVGLLIKKFNNAQPTERAPQEG